MFVYCVVTVRSLFWLFDFLFVLIHVLGVVRNLAVISDLGSPVLTVTLFVNTGNNTSVVFTHKLGEENGANRGKRSTSQNFPETNPSSGEAEGSKDEIVRLESHFVVVFEITFFFFAKEKVV